MIMKKTCIFFAAVFLMVSVAAAQNINHQRDNNNGDDNYSIGYQQRDNNYGNKILMMPATIITTTGTTVRGTGKIAILRKGKKIYR